jgi:hypothetical protein
MTRLRRAIMPAVQCTAVNVSHQVSHYITVQAGFPRTTRRQHLVNTRRVTPRIVALVEGCSPVALHLGSRRQFRGLGAAESVQSSLGAAKLPIWFSILGIRVSNTLSRHRSGAWQFCCTPLLHHPTLPSSITAKPQLSLWMT